MGIESICCEKSLFIKRVQKHIGIELNTSKQRWIESSCVLCKLVQHIAIICHTKLFGQCYNKNLLISCLFWCFFNFFRLAASFVLDFFSKISKMGATFMKYRKFALGNPVICIWGLITKHGYCHEVFGCWVVGPQRPRYDLTSEWKMPKLCLTIFFEILTSQKKSQLISAVCLHFFKKIVNPQYFSLVSENYITDI